jgi:hypothetical protein
MRRTILTRLLAGTAVLAGAWAAFTQQNKQAAQPMKVNKITDDLYDDIMANVKKLTDKPVKYLLNTHQHGDHTGSNAKMIANGVEIIIHKNARANMVKGVIPGHGALMKRADLEKFRSGFLTMHARVRDMSRQNKSRDDISKMLQMDFGWGALNTGGLDRMIAELK